ncbi:MAG: hypothetical protein ABI882_12820 [Acidobacteriota bacterium]
MEKAKAEDVYHLTMYELGDDGFCVADFLESEWLKSKFAASVKAELRSRGLDGEGYASDALAHAVASSVGLDARLKLLSSIAFLNKMDEVLMMPPPATCATDRDAEERVASLFLNGENGRYSRRNVHFCVESLKPPRFQIFAWDRGWFAATKELSDELLYFIGLANRKQ